MMCFFVLFWVWFRFGFGFGFGFGLMNEQEPPQINTRRRDQGSVFSHFCFFLGGFFLVSVFRELTVFGLDPPHDDFLGDLVSVSYETQNRGDPDQIEGNGTKNNKKKRKKCRLQNDQPRTTSFSTDNYRQSGMLGMCMMLVFR